MNIPGNLKGLLFCFQTFCFRPKSPGDYDPIQNLPDPVRIQPDPDRIQPDLGRFSGSRTSMERLKPKK